MAKQRRTAVRTRAFSRTDLCNLHQRFVTSGKASQHSRDLDIRYRFTFVLVIRVFVSYRIVFARAFRAFDRKFNKVILSRDSEGPRGNFSLNSSIRKSPEKNRNKYFGMSHYFFIIRDAEKILEFKSISLLQVKKQIISFYVANFNILVNLTR